MARKLQNILQWKNKKYKWKEFVFEVDEYGDLNLIKPEFYEGMSIDKKPTVEDFKTVIADWIDLAERQVPLSQEEIKIVKKNFTNAEQKEIFGMSIDAFIREFDIERTG